MNLFGESFGGMVAQAYAITHPQAVKRLILADTFYSGEMWWQANNDSCNYEIRNQYPEVWDELQRLRAKGLRSSAPEHQKLYYVPLGLLYFYDASKASLLPKEEGNNDVYYAVAGDDADFKAGGEIAALDFRADLPKLKMPVLVIAGRYDRVSVPRYVVQFKRYLPRARFVAMEESGHFSFIGEPDKTLALLRAFLQASQ